MNGLGSIYSTASEYGPMTTLEMDTDSSRCSSESEAERDFYIETTLERYSDWPAWIREV